MELARKYNGEIICADSRTVYKGMDIGTAKPNKTEQAEIPHHLLDIITPDQPFSAAKFKKISQVATHSIYGRGKLAIMVGGTGLYVDGVIFDFAFLPPVEPDEREHLYGLTIEELQAKITRLGIAMPKNSQNKRHLVRAVETNGAVAVKKGLRANTLIIGLEVERAELEKRIGERTSRMIQAGLEQEVERLADTYGWEAPGLSAVGYREWRAYFAGSQGLEETVAQIQTNTLHYAKRQRTWFRRNPHIQWVKNGAGAEQLLKYFLQQT